MGTFGCNKLIHVCFSTVPRMGYGRPLSSTAAADVETLQVAGGGAPVPRGWSFGVPWRLVLVFFFGGGLKISDLFKGFRMVFWILFWLHGFLRCSCVFFLGGMRIGRFSKVQLHFTLK